MTTTNTMTIHRRYIYRWHWNNTATTELLITERRIITPPPPPPRGSSSSNSSISKSIIRIVTTTAKAKRNVAANDNDNGTTTTTTTTISGGMCIICFEDFQVGDDIVWSQDYTKCIHPTCITKNAWSSIWQASNAQRLMTKSAAIDNDDDSNCPTYLSSKLLYSERRIFGPHDIEIGDMGWMPCLPLLLLLHQLCSSLATLATLARSTSTTRNTKNDRLNSVDWFMYSLDRMSFVQNARNQYNTNEFRRANRIILHY